MNIKPLHPNFKLPVRSTDLAGGYDIFMPEDGVISPRGNHGIMVGLGFSASVPKGHVALLLPRSGTGAKKGLALNNTVGVIDPDYTGEWKACLRVHNNDSLEWFSGDRIVQFIIVPVATPELQIVDELDSTLRGEGGFGSTSK